MVASGKLDMGPSRGLVWLVAGLALLALAAPARLGADAAFEGGALRGLLESRGFTSAQTQAALARIEQAQMRGLPASVLVNRVREGIARGAPPAAILGVLSDRLSDLERADDIARRCGKEGIAVRERERSLMRLADSLAMGVTPGDVLVVLPAASRANRDLESVSGAGEVMGRLGQKGFPPAETRDIVASALASGWTREQMDGLVHVWLEAQRLGLSRERVRQTLADGIRDKKEPEALVEDLKRSPRAEAASAESGESPASGSPSGSSSSPKKGKAGGTHGAPPKGSPPHPPVPHTPHR